MKDGLQLSLKTVSLSRCGTSPVQGCELVKGLRVLVLYSEVSAFCDFVLGDVHNESLGLQAGATTFNLCSMDGAQGYLQI